MPRNVKMDLDKAIEHRMKASKLVFKYAKATGEALNKAFYQHLHYLKVLRSVKMIFEGAEGEAYEDYERSYAWVQNRRGGGKKRKRRKRRTFRSRPIRRERMMTRRKNDDKKKETQDLEKKAELLTRSLRKAVARSWTK